MQMIEMSAVAYGKRFSIIKGGEEAARVYLYIMHNDLHQEPFALLEDVFTEDAWRGRGYATQLIKRALMYARKQGCYKVIATRKVGKEWLDDYYARFGFACRGAELRLELL